MKKFIQSSLLNDMEVLTDEGWSDVVAVHKTIPYKVFFIKTKNYELKCADNHILFDQNMNEVFAKDIKIGDHIMTKSGSEDVLSAITSEQEENMYDLELDYGSKERYYTNNILSHNTTYLKYLTKQIKEKNILFISPSMAEVLSEPSIIPFLMDNRNSILLIEDAEKVITDRKTQGSSVGVSNILNLTDGILGDCLNIQVIATFNMERGKIDNALLRKGRLICEHKFDKLSVEDTNILLKHLSKDAISDKPLSLADIYNIDVELNKVSSDGDTVGFKTGKK